MRGSVGAVVDFITGLVSRGPSLSREAAPLEDDSAQSTSHPWSPPPSPLAHALHIKNNNRVKRVPSRTSLSRQGSSEGIRRRTTGDLPTDVPHAYQAIPHSSSQGLPHNPRSYLRAHHHHLNIGHHHQPNHYSSKSASTKPDSHNPPNARAYLRHMVSAPNIQPLAKRPSLSEASLRSYAIGRERRDGARHTFILNDEDSIAESDYEPHPRITIGDNEHQIHPPLPRNWIESVARALLNGVGGPAAVASDAASSRTAKTVSTRMNCALSDKSNQGERGRTLARGTNQGERGRALARGTKPPLLCVQVQDVKARTSQGQVACTRVMCRSAPTSRAGSRVRNSVHEDHTNIRNSGKPREGDQSRNRRRGKDRDVDVVPSLARTKVENDDWMAPRQRYASGWGVQNNSQAYPDGTWSDDSDHDDDDDDEEEGELGLDRLLVPARRQHSIQSLRKHLQRHPSQAFSSRGAPGTRSPRSGRASPFERAPTGRLEWGDGSWGTGHSRDWLSSRGEEDEDGYSHAVGSGRSSTKWRPGLPSLTQWTTSS